MINKLNEFTSAHRREIYYLFHRYIKKERPFLLESDIREIFQEYSATESGQILKDTIIEEMVNHIQVAAIQKPWIFLAVRRNIAEWDYFRFHHENVYFDEIDIQAFLKFEEKLVSRQQSDDDWVLEVDLAPFYRDFPKMKERKSIGKGVTFLNRHLSSLLFSDIEKGARRLFDFLHMHKYDGEQLMLNNRISNVSELRHSLRSAVEFLEEQPKDHTWIMVGNQMQEKGFEAGWGRTIKQTLENMNLLIDILEAPDPQNLESFLGNLPMIFNIVIISPHGYFGQSNVLGKPDTGGQIVYILDQVRALEREITKQLYNQGLDIAPKILIITRLIPEAGETTCDQKEEEVIGTQYSKILRVPFRNKEGDIIPHWISRFKVWPYLETFAKEVRKEILAELGKRPDLIIGNYSDGNLVATLLSEQMEVTQCNIAHALEKTKYLFSDLYWKDREEQYHFSTQFTADLIAMNAADFIVTSTYHEIAGTKAEVGQYESYTSYTMPDLYRVINGLNVYDPKFNIVSPGSDPNEFFPYSDKEKRMHELHADIENMIFGDYAGETRGHIQAPDKPLLFLMARLDLIKNIPGFIEFYGRNQTLRELVNVFAVAGHINTDKSKDDEEKQQIDRMHHLFDEYNLEDQVRWIEMQGDKNLVGEIYRYVADKRGAFIQPALYEAFGLTVIEAMTSGLPTFATLYGGPREIIEHGQSGYHIDPNSESKTIKTVADFFKKSQDDPESWEKISRGGIQRVKERYTWQIYSHRMMSYSRIYGFWKYVSNLERQETRRYLEMLYGLMYRRLAEESH